MKNSLHKTLEIIGYLVLALAIPSVAALIRRLHPKADIWTAEDIGWLITYGLLISGLPGLISFYLFRKWRAKQRLIVPAVALLMEVLWSILAFLDKGDSFAYVFIAIFFPPAGIAIATILAASLSRLRQNNPPVKLYHLVIAVLAQLLAGVFLPVMLIYISILRNI